MCVAKSEENTRPSRHHKYICHLRLCKMLSMIQSKVTGALHRTNGISVNLPRPPRHHEFCVMMVPFCHRHQQIFWTEVQWRKVFGRLQAIDGVIDAGNRADISLRNFVEMSITHTKSNRTIFFPDEHYRRRNLSRAQLHRAGACHSLPLQWYYIPLLIYIMLRALSQRSVHCRVDTVSNNTGFTQWLLWKVECLNTWRFAISSARWLLESSLLMEQLNTSEETSSGVKLEVTASRWSFRPVSWNSIGTIAFSSSGWKIS